MASYAARTFVRYAPAAAKTFVQYAPKIAQGVRYARNAYAGFQAAKAGYATGKKLFTKKKTVAIPKKAVIIQSRKGVYKGNYNAPRKQTNIKKNVNKKYKRKHNMRGSVAINEYGGNFTAASTEAIYIAHGVAVDEVVKSFWRSVVKELMNQRKTDIVNWEDTIEFPNSATTSQLIFAIRYVNDPSSGTHTVISLPDYVPVVGTTYEGCANGLYTTWRNNSGAGDQPKELVEIYLYGQARNAADTGTYIDVLGKINFKQCKFNFDISSNLKVQNRTLAEVSSAAEPSGERDNSQDVENSPLVGKLYTVGKKWANYIDPAQKSSVNTSGLLFNKKLVADATTGIVQFQTGSSGGAPLRKPPPGWVLGFKNDKYIRINPGNMMSNSFRFKTEMTTSTFFTKFSQILGNSTANTQATQGRLDFGQLNCIGLEKYLDSFRSSGTEISLGYQVTQRYVCTLLYKQRTASMPLVNNSSTFISATTDKPT